MSPSIPRRIIQTAKDRNLSLRQQACVSNLTLLNPDFEYRLFDNRDVVSFLQDEFPRYVGVFDSFRFPIQKYDFFRYLAVYRYGGFYFDLDVFLARGLTDLLDAQCVFPFEELNMSRFLRETYGMDWDIGNYAFGAAAGCDFLLAVIENCVRAQTDRDWVSASMRGIPRHSWDDFFILNTTGPGLLTRTLAENAALSRTVTVLFPENVCDRETWHCFGEYGFHLMEGSWRRRAGLLRRQVAARWERRTLKAFLKESTRTGTSRCLATMKPIPASTRAI